MSESLLVITMSYFNRSSVMSVCAHLKRLQTFVK